MRITFRTATHAEASPVAEVYLASRKTFLPFAPSAHSDDEVRQWMADVLIPTGGVTVAVNDIGPVGMMALSRQGPLGWIDQLYLHPSFVGRGIGSQLMARAKQELESPIRLYTFQANTAARRFYEGHEVQAIVLSDGRDNEEHCPDVLFEWRRSGR